MIAPFTYQPSVCVADYAPSYAASHVSKGYIRQREDYAVRSVALQRQAMEELTDRFLDSRFENWDGYGAEKVDNKAYFRARDLLARLANRFPAPTASVSPYGSLTLEWIANPKRRLILSIGADDQIAFAAVFGADTIHGVATFVQDVPHEILHQLSRLFFA